MRVEGVMTKSTAVIFESDFLEQAVCMLAEHRLEGTVACRREGEIVGNVDGQRCIVRPRERENDVCEVMRPPSPPPSTSACIEDIEFDNGPLRPVVDENGRLVGMLTKRKYLAVYEKVVPFRLKHMDAIFNAVHNGILSIDGEERITSINPPAEKMVQEISLLLTDVVVSSGLLGVVRTGKGHTEKNTASASASILRTVRRLLTKGE